MEEIKQNMTITFREGGQETFYNYAQHQLGNGFIQILLDDHAVIYPSDIIAKIVVTEGE